MTPDTVTGFWFGALTEGFADDAHRKRWFASDAAFDHDVMERFGRLLSTARQGGLADWLATPEGCLAYVLVTDQFSRQIHRGSAAAFATDPLALAAARDGIERGADRVLGYDERAFFYLPFEHSEALLDQHTAVGLLAQLRDETPAPHRHHTGAALRYAQRHRDIIQRFGRFPHRNALLGRESTPGELEFLGRSGNFGQPIGEQVP